MATIKSYSNLQQSKKLAEILPLESADMYYQYVLPKSDKIKHNPEIGNPINALEWYNKGYTLGGKEPIKLDDYCVPCWSLAALLDILPNGIVMNKDSQNGMYHFSSKYIGTSVTADNPVDACVAMIIMLSKNGLI